MNEYGSLLNEVKAHTFSFGETMREMDIPCKSQRWQTIWYEELAVGTAPDAVSRFITNAVGEEAQPGGFAKRRNQKQGQQTKCGQKCQKGALSCAAGDRVQTKLIKRKEKKKIKENRIPQTTSTWTDLPSHR